VQLYLRLAFLRWDIINYKELDGDAWWLKVDDTLSSFRSKFVTELAISAAFTDLYHKDKAQFGDPAVSGIKAAEVRDLDSWQVVLQAHARNVVPPKQKLESKKRKDRPE